jgi:hypothetical protein
MKAIQRRDVIPTLSSSLLFPPPLVYQSPLHVFISAESLNIVAAHRITFCSGLTSVTECHRSDSLFICIVIRIIWYWITHQRTFCLWNSFSFWWHFSFLSLVKSHVWHKRKCAVWTCEILDNQTTVFVEQMVNLRVGAPWITYVDFYYTFLRINFCNCCMKRFLSVLSWLLILLPDPLSWGQYS